jgi:hypothetical protein
MHSIERRLERVAEAIGNSGCTCTGQGSWIVVRYVGPVIRWKNQVSRESGGGVYNIRPASGSSASTGLAVRGWKLIGSCRRPMSEQNDCPIANEGPLCDRIGATKGDDWVA